MKTVLILSVFASAIVSGRAEPSSRITASNWSGNYTPCSRHDDLLTHTHVDLAVRFSTVNAELAGQFARALQFWSGVLDLDWHEVQSEDCAIQLVDGTPALFDFCVCMSAKAHLPDRSDFQGWVAFNPRMKLTPQEMFFDSVHEIGHLLGLAHNPSESSVMYYFGTDRAASLNAADLSTLAARHQLRSDVALHKGGVKIIPARVVPR